MNIRPYRESDRPALKAITVEAFASVAIDSNIEKVFGVIAGHDWRWRKARQIDEDCEAPGSAIWVAEYGQGAIVGYITTRLDGEAGIGWIHNLAVTAGLRGQGVGRRLIQHALEKFRAAGLELARIETLDQNPVGQHLYPDCGFVEVARQLHFALRL
jgi:ribosomal protein S18 acetylase RimI-like enzyme